MWLSERTHTQSIRGVTYVNAKKVKNNARKDKNLIAWAIHSTLLLREIWHRKTRFFTLRNIFSEPSNSRSYSVFRRFCMFFRFSLSFYVIGMLLSHAHKNSFNVHTRRFFTHILTVTRLFIHTFIVEPRPRCTEFEFRETPRPWKKHVLAEKSAPGNKGRKTPRRMRMR